MKRKINITEKAEVMPVDHIAEANGKYLSVEDKIVVEGTKLLNNTKTEDSIKKRKIVILKVV